jgi:hypothetical protein
MHASGNGGGGGVGVGNDTTLWLSRKRRRAMSAHGLEVKKALASHRVQTLSIIAYLGVYMQRYSLQLCNLIRRLILFQQELILLILV